MSQEINFIYLLFFKRILRYHLPLGTGNQIKFFHWICLCIYWGSYLDQFSRLYCFNSYLNFQFLQRLFKVISFLLNVTIMSFTIFIFIFQTFSQFSGKLFLLPSALQWILHIFPFIWIISYIFFQFSAQFHISFKFSSPAIFTIFW